PERVATLARGGRVSAGRTRGLTQRRGLFVIGLVDGQQFPRDDVARLGFEVMRIEPYWEVALKDGQSIDPVLELLQARGLKLRHLTEKRTTLEDLFIQTVEAAEPGVDEPLRRSVRRQEQ